MTNFTWTGRLWMDGWMAVVVGSFIWSVIS